MTQKRPAPKAKGTLDADDWGEYATAVAGPGAAAGATLRPRPRDVELGPFVTERGATLPELNVRVEAYGPEGARRSNAVVVVHALTGSAHLAGVYDDETFQQLSPLERAFGPRGWWDAVVGPGKPLDTERFFVVCANLPGSCYGSTGPLSPNPETGRPYGFGFPRFSVRDWVRVHLQLLDALGIDQARVIGGSLGGMVALEFALMAPDRVAGALVIAAPARHGPWARAFNRLAREAIALDPKRGLALARGLAMLSYRSPQSFEERWGHEPARGETYVLHHGQKFVRRFDAASYVVLSEAMDGHDVARGRGPLPQVLRGLKPPTLFVGLDSDVLYPSWEVREVARLAGADYVELTSPHGHDAFLIEHEPMGQIVRDFLSATPA